MHLSSNGADCLNSYALVTYIPDPLGEFLDGLRREIAPRCNPHAHISILPPRPILGSAGEAWSYIQARVEPIPAFTVQATRIEVFPVTSVIYIALGDGRSDFEQMHATLNGGLLDFEEPFTYHPHITLAQELAPEDVAPALDLAQRRWSEWRREREFLVDNVTFVQNTNDCGWLDLAFCHLSATPLLRGR